MEKEIILDNEHITIWYHPDKKIVHSVFKKYTFGKDYREFLSAIYNAIQTHSAHKYLADDRKNQGISKDDQEWGRTNWFPHAKAAGWKYWAIVLPENAVGKLTMKHVIADVSSQGVATKAFTDPGLAMAWLENQK
jgi:hypothetical protein